MLLINSSDQNAFIALYDGSELYVSHSTYFGNNPAKKQPDNLINCLNYLKETYSDIFNKISAIAVTTGPGSFTGIRVGIAIAKGAAGALDLPMIPITNFEVVYDSIPDKSGDINYCIMIPAKPPEYYYSIWKNGTEKDKGSVDFNKFAEISGKNAVLVGNFDAETKAKHSYFTYLDINKSGSQTDSLLRLALKKFNNNELVQPKEIEPLYLIDFKLKKSF